MNKDLLKKHVMKFVSDSKENQKKFEQDFREREDLVRYYQSFKEDRLLSMSEEEIYEYLSRLWAMLIWGNKRYVVDKIIEDNGSQNFKKILAQLVWGKKDICERWDSFRSEIKGMGPAMTSEILCKTHPSDFMLWNRRAYVGLNYLEVENLPKHDYQLTGQKYKYLCDVCKGISQELKDAGLKDTTLLAVDYFIWEQLQVEENLSKIHRRKSEGEMAEVPEESKFMHDDIRDKLRDIGQWLGFTARIEQKVSEGSKVDTVWEQTIGNMGRVIYVFEVQTKGSLDSLIINLLKSMKNAAVQGVVAVSDQEQLERIRGHVLDIKELKDKIKYWDYEEVLKVHESLEFVMANINKLGLVPQSF
jgi:hypothetical protein